MPGWAESGICPQNGASPVCPHLRVTQGNCESPGVQATSRAHESEPRGGDVGSDSFYISPVTPLGAQAQEPSLERVDATGNPQGSRRQARRGCGQGEGRGRQNELPRFTCIRAAVLSCLLPYFVMLMPTFFAQIFERNIRMRMIHG